jgi:hypothetical protein
MLSGDTQSGNRKYNTIHHDGIEVQKFGIAIALRGRSTSKVLASCKIAKHGGLE